MEGMKVWKFPVAGGDGKARMALTHAGWPAVCLVDYDGGGELCVWGSVHEDDSLNLDLNLHVAGTGHKVGLNWWHAGSVVSPEGFVWHVFAQPVDFEAYDELMAATE